MAETFVYEYELRRADAIVATGRFTSERPLDEGDRVTVERSATAEVERVLPSPGLAGRLVLRAA